MQLIWRVGSKMRFFIERKKEKTSGLCLNMIWRFVNNMQHSDVEQTKGDIFTIITSLPLIYFNIVDHSRCHGDVFNVKTTVCVKLDAECAAYCSVDAPSPVIPHAAIAVSFNICQHLLHYFSIPFHLQSWINGMFSCLRGLFIETQMNVVATTDILHTGQ